MSITQCIEDARVAVQDSDRAQRQGASVGLSATAREVALLRDSLRALIQAVESLEVRSRTDAGL